MDKKIDKSQLRRESMKRLAGWGVAVVAAVAAAVWVLSSVSTAVKSTDITLVTVDEGPLETTAPASGRVVPAHEEIINSPVSTRLIKVFAQPGDTVREGMPLLMLDLQEEETALDKLIDARNIRQQELIQLRLNNRTMLSDLEMQIKVSEMNISRLRIEANNERRLDSLGSGTGDRVRQAETAYAEGRLQLEQLRVKLANERHRAAASEHVQQLNVNSADKDIALKRSTLHRGRIPAPMDGVLTYVATELGSQIGAGEKVAVVSDLTSFKVIGEVAESYGNRVDIGSRVGVRFAGRQTEGTVTNITPQARQGLIEFVVTLDDPGYELLRSGQRTELNIVYGYKDRVTRLRSGAFFKGAGDYSLFVLDGDNTLVKRAVRIGDSNREYVEVLSGLRPGDRVVTSDMENYKNKNKLRINRD